MWAIIFVICYFPCSPDDDDSPAEGHFPNSSEPSWVGCWAYQYCKYKSLEVLTKLYLPTFMHILEIYLKFQILNVKFWTKLNKVIWGQKEKINKTVSFSHCFAHSHSVQNKLLIYRSTFMHISVHLCIFLHIYAHLWMFMHIFYTFMQLTHTYIYVHCGTEGLCV